MNRRDFLKLLGVGSTVTAAGLLVPEAPRRIYSFLTDNPLARRPASFLVYERMPLPAMPLIEGAIPDTSVSYSLTRVMASVNEYGQWFDPEGRPAEKSPWWLRRGFPFKPTEYPHEQIATFDRARGLFPRHEQKAR